MWLLIFIVPVVYLVVGFFVDNISDKAKEINRNRYYGEDALLYYSTFKSNTVTRDDIMRLFALQVKKYRQRNYNISYKIFTGKGEQNYAWSIKTTKQTFGWGIIYNIYFCFSNGWVYISFSNEDFSSGGSPSLPYYLEGRDFGTRVIEGTLNTCKDEAIITWKINGNAGRNYLPFDFIPLSGSAPNVNNAKADSIISCQTLLGLKLQFSRAELEKIV